jgi:hypothetical protein
MKTRIVLFLAISAIVTLSFTFGSVKADKKAKAEQSTKDTSTEPVGGFIAEDKI